MSEKPTNSSVDSTKVHPSLSAYLGYCLYKSAMLHKEQLDKALSEYSLIGSQLGILLLLNVLGPTSQVELGDIMGIDKATMVKLLDGLESNSWVKRVGHEQDRRVKNAVLTEAGKKTLKDLLRVRESVEKNFLSVLSHEEEKQLRKILPKLLRISQP